MTIEEVAAVRDVLKRAIEDSENTEPEELQAAIWQAVDIIGQMQEMDTKWSAIAYRVNNIIHETDCLRQEVA